MAPASPTDVELRTGVPAVRGLRCSSARLSIAPLLLLLLLLLLLVCFTLLLAARSVPEAYGQGAKLEERYAIVVGGEPKEFLPDGRGRLFVTDFAGGAVAEVDLVTGLVRRRLAAPGRPAGMALSSDGTTLFVAGYDGNALGQGRIYRFDLDGGQRDVVTGIADPWSLELVTGPGGRELLAVTEHHGEAVAFFDPVTLRREQSVGTAAYPYHLAVDPARGRLYVASYGGARGGELLAVDLATLAPAWRRTTGKGTFEVQVDPLQDRILVTDFTARNLEVFRPDGTALGRFALAGRPKGGRVPDSGGEAYVALQDLDLVTGYDLITGQNLWSTPVGLRPAATAWLSQGPAVAAGAVPGPAALTGAGQVLAVANEGDGTVSLLAPGIPVPEFSDVPRGHPHHRDIRILALRGALNGYPNGDGSFSFRPGQTLMRAQAAKILVGSLALHTEAIDHPAIAFRDVPDETGTYPYDYVQEAARAGLVLGKATNPPSFAPYETVSRIQVLRMVVRAASSMGTPLPLGAGPSPYADVDSSHPDLATIMAAYRAGLMEGVRGSDGALRLKPYEAASRAVTSRAVVRLLGALGPISVPEPGG